jgi:hypothetical protein
MPANWCWDSERLPAIGSWRVGREMRYLIDQMPPPVAALQHWPYHSRRPA